MAQVQPDWRIVKSNQTKHVRADFLRDHGVTECGVLYLVDANRHVYICSLTPAIEAFPVQAYADFVDAESSQRDEGETEQLLMLEEEPVSYFDTNFLSNTSVSAANYIPEREEDESDEDYYKRIPDAVAEHLAGNPISL